MSEPQVYIGLDVGAKRIGLARGNSLARLASPLEIVDVNGQEISQIGQIADRENAVGLVVGLPRGLNGQETAQTQAVRKFGQKLQSLGLNVHYQDEAGTSLQAEAESRKPERHLDDHAAAIILQDFLDNL